MYQSVLMLTTGCVNGMFGKGCSSQCSENCLDNGPCNSTTGHCDDGCDPGYVKPFCNKSMHIFNFLFNWFITLSVKSIFQIYNQIFKDI